MLVALPIRLEGTSRPIGITLRANTTPSPAARLFCDELRNMADELDFFDTKAHVTAPRKRVVTWAARVARSGNKVSNKSRLNVFSGVVTVEPPPQRRIWSCKHSQIWPKLRCSEVSGRLMAASFRAAWQKPRPIQAEFSVTPVFRVRIVAHTRRCHCGKVARKTPPCESERGRQNPVVLESAERVTQGHFDATVSDDRVHLRTIAMPLRLGTAPSNLSRLLRGSVP